MRIFIDMDGVFVDFMQGCINYFDADLMPERDWPKGSWGTDAEFKQFFGKSGDDFWVEIGFRAFWKHLPYTYDGKDFLDYIEKYYPVILTSPCQGGADGKMDWIKRELNKYFRDGRYMMGRGKHYLASPDAVLIDDSDENIRRWEKYGGIGILYPRPWNDQHAIKNPLRHVKNRLNATIKLSKF